MTLSIVILSYNTLDLVLDSINSLKKQFDEELEKEIIEIIIVDNSSEKDVIEGIEKNITGLKNIKLIKSKENLGFGRGCNLGVENSKGEYVLFLNSDTRTENRGFLDMVDFLKKNPKTGILGGKIVNFDSTPQASAGKFYNLLNFLIMMLGGEKFGLLRFSPSKTCQVDWVSGACMMVNKELFKKTGGFDKNIFMYMEDMELCFRAKKSGILTYFFSNVMVLHKELGSSNRAFAVVNIYKGILYFYKKHKNSLSYQIVRLILYLKARIVYIFGKITNNSYYINAYGQALELFK